MPLHLVYAVASTSWLLYGVFIAATYSAIFLTCIFQFNYASSRIRRLLRKFVYQLQFVHDTIALFDIPALEIDVDVEGLMVIRGLTISLSTLSVVAHGVEVGIKLANDIELAISTEKVTVHLFRRIEISDCFANVKGGTYEMTFGELEDGSDKDEDGDAIVVEATPLLQAAAAGAKGVRPKINKMKSHMTRGIEMKDSAAKAGFDSIKTVSPEDKDAGDKYEKMLKSIDDSNIIQLCRKEVQAEATDLDSKTDVRAAICSKMQHTTTVPHPPTRSIKVTTLQNLSSPRTRSFLHRLPLLLRLLLNPIAYLHPVYIASITAGGSGKWISFLLKTHLFKDYAEDNRELRRLEKRILAWLTDANFVFELADIKGTSSVPVSPTFDILAMLKFGDIIAYRSMDKVVELEDVVRLGGADASFTIPSFLLPHHEHLLPPKPNRDIKEELKDKIDDAEGAPQQLKAEHELEQVEADEANVTISTHVQLPACFSQDLLNFIAALVKASKVVELEKNAGLSDEKMSGIKEFGHALSKGMKDGIKKTVVDGMISDKWIAKMVGKATRMLEQAQGDVGYSGDIPVKLELYRLPEGHPEMRKILP